jgi:hypothetical protein
MVKKPKPTRKQLERKLLEMEAQLASSYHFSSVTLKEFTYPKLMASGVLLQLSTLGNTKSMVPVVIRGGLSQETVNGLLKDMNRSYEESIELKPKGV